MASDDQICEDPSRLSPKGQATWADDQLMAFEYFSQQTPDLEGLSGEKPFGYGLQDQEQKLEEFAKLQDEVVQMMDKADEKEAVLVNRFDPGTLRLVETLRGSVRKDKTAVVKARKIAEKELGAGAWQNWYHVLRQDFEDYFEQIIYHDDDFIHTVIQWHRGVKSPFHFAFCLKMFVRLAAVRAFTTTIDAHSDSLNRLAESLEGTRV